YGREAASTELGAGAEIEREPHLRRGSSRDEKAYSVRIRRPGGGEPVAQLRRHVVPGDGLLNAAGLPLERFPHSTLAFDPVVFESADVAHPVVVDVGIEPRREADELRSFCPLRLRLDPRGDVAALRALRADRVGREGVVPRPRLNR